jgi:D-alanyl-D-alanine carboxypeptidase
LIGASILTAFLALGLAGVTTAAARPGGGAATPVFAWIVLDAQTGQVLGEQNADVLTYPASLTKMMTLYVTFEALNQGRVRIDQLFRVSADAASRPPSKLGLIPGETVPLRDLILGLVTRSANDAAAVIAENLAGSEANFARYMTWKARQLGMNHTWFQNASGLPDPGQRTTARDIARLSLALYYNFPREYRYFSTQEFHFRGHEINTHNRLLEWYQGADGIKTGFINASGFNVATSAVRNGRRLIGVIMGGQSARIRDLQMASLLDQGFARLDYRPPATTLVASAPAASAPAASPRPSSSTAIAATAPAAPTATVAAQSAPAPAPATRAVAAATPVAALAEDDDDDDEEDDAPAPKTEAVRRLADNALRHLTPVSKARATPAVQVRETANGGWSIQLGAFRDQAAARRVLHQAAGVAAVKGKPQQVLAPAKSERTPLYRARLLNFSETGARAACAELQKRKLACTVVRSATRLARG